MSQWLDCVKAIARSNIEFPELKVVQLSQSILESERGRSDLFRNHKNPYGMKYRSEMASLATSVTYTDHAGETDQYCDFADFDTTARAYWVFIDRPVYQGWRNHVATPEAFIRFIAYAGYIGGPYDGTPENRSQKEAYIGKVTSLFAEARQLLAAHAPEIGPDPIIGDPESGAHACAAGFFLGRAKLHAERSKDGSQWLEKAAEHLEEAADPGLNRYAEQARALSNPWQNDAVLIDDLELAVEAVSTDNSDYANAAISGYLLGGVYGHCELGAGEASEVSLMDDVQLAAERAVLLSIANRCSWDESNIRHEFSQVSERIERYGASKLNLLKPSIDVLMKSYWGTLR